MKLATYMKAAPDGYTSQGLTAVGSTPEQMVALVREESKEMARIVKAIGYKPQ